MSLIELGGHLGIFVLDLWDKSYNVFCSKRIACEAPKQPVRPLKPVKPAPVEAHRSASGGLLWTIVVKIWMDGKIQ